MLVTPSYYPDFHCIADRCRHSCCISWDVVVDDETADRYRCVTGDFGKRLCENMHTDADGDTVFSMRDNGHCPFLNARGLCDIILTLGEDALCRICDDHPRFYHTYSDRTEAGLGLCCEEAARLILSQTAPMTLIPQNDDTCSPTERETTFFAARERLFAIAKDRTRTVSQREEALLTAVGAKCESLSADELLDVFLPLERLDETWTQTLFTLRETPSFAPPDDIVLEQLLCYFLFRHTADTLYDDLWAGRVAFAVHSVRLLNELATRVAGDFEAFCDLCRQYSAEIEYSSENPDLLIERFS